MNIKNYYSLMEDKTIALIIDGFINGLGVVRSLKNNNIFIVVLCKKKSAISYSKYCNLVINFNDNSDLIKQLILINNSATKVIPFYCSDSNLKIVSSLKNKLDKFSIFELNSTLFNKKNQHIIAKYVGLKIPKTVVVSNFKDIDTLNIENTKYIIKPSKISNNNYLFKSKITNDINLLKKYAILCINNNVEALISEFVSGDDKKLLTYGGYAFEGKIIIDFTGRKISQRPKLNGVASMAESIVDNKLPQLGEKFIKEIGFTGIFQIEFKKDEENNYYFIEFNPRNWSWAFVSTIYGVNLSLAKFSVESNQEFEYKTKGRNNFYLWLEGIFYNVLIDKWFTVFYQLLKQLFKTKVTCAIFSIKDPLPFMFYIRNTVLYFLKIRKELR